MDILQFVQKTTHFNISLAYILYFTTTYLTRIAHLIYIMRGKNPRKYNVFTRVLNRDISITTNNRVIHASPPG